MKLFGSFVSAAVVAGAGLAYYVHRRKTCTGASYLDVIKELPGQVQRVSTEARQRAAEAVEKGKAAARRRDAELARELEAAGSRSAAEPSVSSAAPSVAEVAPAPPAAESGPVTV